MPEDKGQASCEAEPIIIEGREEPPETIDRELDIRAKLITKPIIIDGALAFMAEEKIEDKWRLPDADGTIRFQVCNRGRINEMHDSLKDYLATRGVILTHSLYYFEHALSAHKLVCRIGIPKGLESITINLKKQGYIFKRTAVSIKGDIPEDIAAHLKSAIFDYAFPNYRIK